MTAPEFYRPAKPLPINLRDTCKNYFEEDLYTSGLTLLLHLLTSGTSSVRPGHPLPAAFVPPPALLSLAGTLLIHPKLTTHPSNPTLDLPSSALSSKLLRTALDTVGPINADLGTAFTFTGSRHHHRRIITTTTGGMRRKRPPSVAASSDHSDGGDDMSISEMHLSLDQIWDVAEDFWHVVGWAFSCTKRHPLRWEKYRVWLEYMCDVLSADLDARSGGSSSQRSGSTPSSADDEQDSGGIECSLLHRYIDSGMNAFGGGLKRIMRAVLATGTDEDVREFPKLFAEEDKTPRHIRRQRRRAKQEQQQPSDRKQASKKEEFDIENYKYGKWEDPASASSSSSSDDENEEVNDPLSTTTDDPDPYETHTLRITLLTLLFTSTHPRVVTTSTPSIHSELSTHLRFLAPSALALYLLTPPYLPPLLFETLLPTLLCTHLSLAPSLPTDLISPAGLAEHLLAAPQQKPGRWSEAARASLWVEFAARMALRPGVGTEWASLVQEAMQRGREVRREVASRKAKKRRDDGEEEEARRVLGGCEGRVEALVRAWAKS